MGLRSGSAAAFVLFFLAASQARGALSAAAVSSSRQQDFYTYHYSITLRDTGTTPIGTFWYAWTPGQDYLPGMPSNVFSPAGWSSYLEAGYDGYSIEWSANSPMSSGQSLSGFDFEIDAPPLYINGNSPSFPGIPVGTSYVYSGSAFSDGGFSFRVAPLPEPASACGVLLMVFLTA